MNFYRKIVNVSELKNGDTVEINGKIETLSSRYLKNCPFLGVTYKGDTFRSGITKIIFVVPTANGFRHE